MPICLPMRPIDDEDALEGKIKSTKYKVLECVEIGFYAEFS